MPIDWQKFHERVLKRVKIIKPLEEKELSHGLYCDILFTEKIRPSEFCYRLRNRYSVDIDGSFAVAGILVIDLVQRLKDGIKQMGKKWGGSTYIGEMIIEEKYCRSEKGDQMREDCDLANASAHITPYDAIICGGLDDVCNPIFCGDNVNLFINKRMYECLLRRGLSERQVQTSVKFAEILMNAYKESIDYMV